MWPTKYIPFPVKPRVSRRFFLTTQPYPIEILETMQSAHTNIYGYKTFKSSETYQSAASILSGTLIVRLRHTVQEPEAYDSETAILSGTLVTRLRHTVQEPEAYDSETAILGGTLNRLLVHYPHWPLRAGTEESHQSSASILSGTLTP
jgi:hypothetical protein